MYTQCAISIRPGNPIRKFTGNPFRNTSTIYNHYRKIVITRKPNERLKPAKNRFRRQAKGKINRMVSQ